MKSGAYIHFPQSVNLSDFSVSLICHLAPLTGWHLYWMSFHEIDYTHSCSPRDIFGNFLIITKYLSNSLSQSIGQSASSAVVTKSEHTKPNMGNMIKHMRGHVRFQSMHSTTQSTATSSFIISLTLTQGTLLDIWQVKHQNKSTLCL